MCPMCLTTVGYVVAGAVSTGGLAAWAAKIARGKSAGRDNAFDAGGRRIQDADQHDR